MKLPDWLGRLTYLTLFFVIVNVAVYFGTNGEYYVRPGWGVLFFVVYGFGSWFSSGYRPIKHTENRLPHDNPDAEPKYETPVLSDWD